MKLRYLLLIPVFFITAACNQNNTNKKTTNTPLASNNATEETPINIESNETREQKNIITEATDSETEQQNQKETKLYKNTAYNFSLAYPNSWPSASPAYKGEDMQSAKEKHVFGTAFDGPDVHSPYGDWTVVVTVIEQKIEDILKDPAYSWNTHGQAPINKENFQYGNNSATRVTWANGTTLVYVENFEQTYTVIFDGYTEGPNNKEYHKDIDAMVASLTFHEEDK